MEKENQDAFVEVFRSTIKALNDHNIRYYLSNGNLLAYERHGVGFMPWDDDIDIVVLNDTELEKIRNIQWKNYKLFLFDTKYPDKQLLESFHRSGGDINALFADITLHLHSMHPVQKGIVWKDTWWPFAEIATEEKMIDYYKNKGIEYIKIKENEIISQKIKLREADKTELDVRMPNATKRREWLNRIYPDWEENAVAFASVVMDNNETEHVVAKYDLLTGKLLEGTEEYRESNSKKKSSKKEVSYAKFFNFYKNH